jgi:DNA-binding response OmpR family regulator
METRPLISIIDDDESRLIEQGAVECLFKPFSDSDLLEALNGALRRS